MAEAEMTECGSPVRDQNFLVLFNAHHEPLPFRLPDYVGARWRALLDTAFGEGLEIDGIFDAGAEYPIKGRSLVLLQQVPA